MDRPLPRKRLDAALDSSAEHATVITVLGPAGSGKTAFLTSWSRWRWAVDGTRCRWLELTELHNDVIRLLRDLDGILPDDSPGDRRRAGTPSVVIIDRIEVLTSPASLAVLDAVLGRPHPWRRIVLSGRRHAVPGLSRALLDRSLVEIGPVDLDLTRVEARQMLLRSGHVLSPDEESVILARADGWAAGLRFEMRRRLQPGYQATGEAWLDPLLEDYVDREVLDGVPPQALDLLMRLSVVDEVPLPLAQVIGGRVSAEALLRSLAQSHRLVRAVQAGVPAEVRFRLHPLLRELLRARFQQRDPIAYEACTHRARQWDRADDAESGGHAPSRLVVGDADGHRPGTDELRAAKAWHRWAILDVDEAEREAVALAHDVHRGQAPAGVALAVVCLETLVGLPSADGRRTSPPAHLLPIWRAQAPHSDVDLLAAVAPVVHRAALDHGLTTLREEVLRTARGRLPGSDVVSVMEAVDHAAHRRPAEAARWLAAVDLMSPGGTDPLTAVRGRILQAVLAARHGDRANAHGAMSRALATAERTRILLPFVEQRLEVAPILAEGFGRFGRLNPVAELARGIAAPSGPADELTEREAQVLTELASLRTVPEMAHELGVSENTVKTHVRNVYRKLGTSSRRQTLMAARRSGLL